MLYVANGLDIVPGREREREKERGGEREEGRERERVGILIYMAALSKALQAVRQYSQVVLLVLVFHVSSVTGPMWKL